MTRVSKRVSGSFLCNVQTLNGGIQCLTTITIFLQLAQAPAGSEPRGWRRNTEQKSASPKSTELAALASFADASPKNSWSTPPNLVTHLKKRKDMAGLQMR